MNKVAKDRELYLENYWLKNKRAIDKGKNGPNFAWVVPAAQRRKADAADLVNELRRQGVEVHTANAAFKVGSIDVAAGDYVIRGDQPYRTLVDMYFSVQNYPAANPRPYDDTGWTMQYMRNVKLNKIADKSIFEKPMTLLTADAKAAGGVEGSGGTLVVEHTSDNNLMTFRFKNKDVKMLVAEEDFDLNGRKLRAGAFIIPNADRAALEPQLQESRTLRLGRRRRAGGEDARHDHPAHRLRAFLVAHAGRRLGARRAGLLQRALHLLRRPETQGRQPARQVRRDHLPARGRHVRIHDQRHRDDRHCADPLQEDRADAEPGRRR